MNPQEEAKAAAKARAEKRAADLAATIAAANGERVVVVSALGASNQKTPIILQRGPMFNIVLYILEELTSL